MTAGSEGSSLFFELDLRLFADLDDVVLVEARDTLGRLLEVFPLLWSSEATFVVRLASIMANSSSNGTASASSSLGIRSPLELRELVVDWEPAVPLRFLP